LVAAVAKNEQVNIKAEILFLLLCILLGAFNDWNSVCNKKIYVYTVPHYFNFSTIPIWMLIYWGMILRFFSRFTRWQALDPNTDASNTIGIGNWKIDNGLAKVSGELLLVLVTRQTIYQFYRDPLLSWMPFLCALGLFLVFFKPTKHDFKLVLIFLLGGPLIEILYIQIGQTHYYYLGWIGGVPVWLVLWWCLIILVWKDISFRIQKVLKIYQ
jgi:hypothetical protein